MSSSGPLWTSTVPQYAQVASFLLLDGKGALQLVQTDTSARSLIWLFIAVPFCVRGLLFAPIDVLMFLYITCTLCAPCSLSCGLLGSVS